MLNSSEHEIHHVGILTFISLSMNNSPTDLSNPKIYKLFRISSCYMNNGLTDLSNPKVYQLVSISSCNDFIITGITVPQTCPTLRFINQAPVTNYLHRKCVPQKFPNLQYITVTYWNLFSQET